MKMVLTVEFPIEPFNSYVRKGTISQKLREVLESINPEAAYFTELDGVRGGIFVITVEDATDVPRYAEPFFLVFQANCKFRIAMTLSDLQSAGLRELGAKWSQPT